MNFDLVRRAVTALAGLVLIPVAAHLQNSRSPVRGRCTQTANQRTGQGRRVRAERRGSSIRVINARTRRPRALLPPQEARELEHKVTADRDQLRQVPTPDSPNIYNASLKLESGLEFAALDHFQLTNFSARKGAIKKDGVYAVLFDCSTGSLQVGTF